MDRKDKNKRKQKHKNGQKPEKKKNPERSATARHTDIKVESRKCSPLTPQTTRKGHIQGMLLRRRVQET
ncbi:hypothetical protein HNY73_015478 [Argiope bruennichi]|uniref:Uncharacterized protein n=1 Tax=Argiope bruennichi TaxID=94029 RepID=A0A8T0EWN2_ARGBR|nr:hypothetical protein HNY73_015478 [Argiope bruennichi]